MKKNIKTPKISILIRAFNESKWINICLKKINEQSIKPFEIIVVDNNSSDGTIELLQSHKSQLAILESGHDDGIYDALNKGLDYVTGNVVGIVSSKLNEVVMAQETGSISQNVNFAIKSSTVQTFLDVNRIDYEVKESKDKVETADIVEISEKFTTPIQCFH